MNAARYLEMGGYQREAYMLRTLSEYTELLLMDAAAALRRSRPDDGPALGKGWPAPLDYINQLGDA